MHVVIVEDESLSAQRLGLLLSNYDPAIRVLAILGSVAEAVDWFSHQPIGNLPDLVFMDIHLEDGSAFGLIERVNLMLPIIFTTAYDTYAIQAFKANSIDYLLKPIDEAELAAAIDKFKWTQLTRPSIKHRDLKLATLVNWPNDPSPVAYKDRFMVTLGSRIMSLEVAQIAYFFYEAKTTYLLTQEGQRMVIEYSLDKLTGLLNPHRFFRVSRAYLVSLGSIQSIHTYSASKLKIELLPAAPHELFISPDRLTSFKTWLGK